VAGTETYTFAPETYTYPETYVHATNTYATVAPVSGTAPTTSDYTYAPETYATVAPVASTETYTYAPETYTYPETYIHTPETYATVAPLPSTAGTDYTYTSTHPETYVHAPNTYATVAPVSGTDDVHFTMRPLEKYGSEGKPNPRVIEEKKTEAKANAGAPRNNRQNKRNKWKPSRSKYSWKPLNRRMDPRTEGKKYEVYGEEKLSGDMIDKEQYEEKKPFETYTYAPETYTYPETYMHAPETYATVAPVSGTETYTYAPETYTHPETYIHTPETYATVAPVKGTETEEMWEKAYEPSMKKWEETSYLMPYEDNSIVKALKEAAEEQTDKMMAQKEAADKKFAKELIEKHFAREEAMLEEKMSMFKAALEQMQKNLGLTGKNQVRETPSKRNSHIRKAMNVARMEKNQESDGETVSKKEKPRKAKKIQGERKEKNLGSKAKKAKNIPKKKEINQGRKEKNLARMAIRKQRNQAKSFLKSKKKAETKEKIQEKKAEKLEKGN